MANIAVLYGSYRAGRLGVRALEFIAQGLSDLGHQVSKVDAAEHEIDVLRSKYDGYEPGEAPPGLESARRSIVAADGYVVICGEYNASLQPGLSNLIDHFLEEYSRKPAGIVSYSYGRFAGVRAAIQARSLLAAVGMVAIPDSLAIGQVSETLDENGSPSEPRLLQSRKRFLEEFTWYVDALSAARRGSVEAS